MVLDRKNYYLFYPVDLNRSTYLHIPSFSERRIYNAEKDFDNCYCSIFGDRICANIADSCISTGSRSRHIPH